MTSAHCTYGCVQFVSICFFLIFSFRFLEEWMLPLCILNAFSWAHGTESRWILFDRNERILNLETRRGVSMCTHAACSFGSAIAFAGIWTWKIVMKKIICSPLHDGLWTGPIVFGRVWPALFWNVWYCLRTVLMHNTDVDRYHSIVFGFDAFAAFNMCMRRPLIAYVPNVQQ